MAVDRCVCRDVMFARLLTLARERGAGFDELQRLTGFGTGCGMCIPYIRAALATGQAEIPVMDVAATEYLRGGRPATREDQGRPSAP